MTAASLLNFLEDFARPGGAVRTSAAGFEFAPDQAERAKAEKPEISLEEALAAAREEGAREARAEMTERHRAELQKLRTEFEAAARQAREAEISALNDAMQGLFAQYDAWLDRMFETSLRPLVARAMRASAMDELKSRLVEAAGREGVKVKLSGPNALTGEMAQMLGAHGMAVEIGAEEGGELCAEVDSQGLATRFARIDELLSDSPEPAREARDE